MATVLVLKAAEHPIKSVTIFKSAKAEVVRTFRVDIAKGQNKVEIKGLSSSIDTHSVRVSGLGDARLYDVVCTVEQGQSAFAIYDDPAEERSRDLAIQKADLEKRKAIRETEGQLLFKYANSLTGEHLEPSKVLQFMGTYVAHSDKIAAAIAELDKSIREVDLQIAQEQKKKKEKKGEAHGRVDVVIAADNDVTIDLVLTYIVDNAKWRPTYELHAKTEGGKPSPLVKLHYRARITQHTGEDWNNTSLSLSTVSGGASRTIPTLKPVKFQPPSASNLFANNNVHAVKGFAATQVQQMPFPQTRGLFGSTNTGGGLFGQQQQQQQQQQSGGSLFGNQPLAQSNALPTQAAAFGFGGAAPSAPQQLLPQAAGVSAVSADEENQLGDQWVQAGSELDPDGSTPLPLNEPTTIVNETPVALTFSVQGQSTIPSDGVDHQVAVAVLPFDATISYVAVPRIDPRVYLQCRVKNTSDYRLLPGSVRVIFDDSFVSSTSINEITTGETFECTLGDDASAKVTYSRTSTNVKSDGGAFAETTNTTTYFTKITVHNKHTFDIGDLIVRDVIPVCPDKRGQVVLKKPDGLAKAKPGQVLSLPDNLKVSWSKKPEGGKTTDGLFEWRWKVVSGAKVLLEAEWDLKVPGLYGWNEAISN